MAIIWSIKDLKEIIEERRKNKFDVNIVFSGPRGNGKSTCGAKLLYRMDGYNAWKHQVYSRKDVIKLLEEQKFGYVFDDEAINSGYKRSFYDKEQQQLIRYLNMYRDNFNLYCLAIPSFYSLDKDIRNLIAIHIHVIRRGVAIVHIANTDMMYSNDPWDVTYNQKLEQKWGALKKKDPDYSPPYHKLTTFKGYLHFNDLTPKQRREYEEIKATKRKELYSKEMEGEQEEDPKRLVIKNTIEMLKNGYIKDREFIQKIAVATGYKVTTFTNQLNKELKENGCNQTVAQLYSTSGGQKEQLINLKSNKNVLSLINKGSATNDT